MAKKEKTQYAQMTEKELSSRLVEAREKLFQLRFQNATAPLKNPRQLPALRRDVARCETFLKQLQLKEKAAAKA